jgi:YVTN family beta-propeller protein
MRKAKFILAIMLALPLINCSEPTVDHSQHLHSALQVIADLVSNKTIKVGNTPHGMWAANGFVYNANNGDGTISVIDTAKDEVVKTLALQNGTSNYIKAFHDQKNILAVDEKQGKLLVYDPAADHKLIQTIDIGEGPDKIVISDDDKMVFVSLTEEDKVVGLTFAADRSKAPEKKEYQAGSMVKDSEHRSLTFADGWLLTPNTADNDVSLINTASGAEKRLSDGNVPATVEIGTDNGKATVAVVGNTASNTVTIFDLNSDSKRTLTDVGLSPTDSAKYEKMNRVFITMAGSNEVTVIDYANKIVLNRIRTGDRPVHIYSVPDLAGTGTEMWIGNDGNDSVTVIDARSFRVKANVKAGKGHHKMAFSGSKAYVSNITDGTVSVIDRTKIQ